MLFPKLATDCTLGRLRKDQRLVLLDWETATTGNYIQDLGQHSPPALSRAQQSVYVHAGHFLAASGCDAKNEALFLDAYGFEATAENLSQLFVFKLHGTLSCWLRELTLVCSGFYRLIAFFIFAIAANAPAEGKVCTQLRCVLSAVFEPGSRKADVIGLGSNCELCAWNLLPAVLGSAGQAGSCNCCTFARRHGWHRCC